MLFCCQDTYEPLKIHMCHFQNICFPEEMKIGIIISGYKFPCSIFDKKTECWHFSIIKYLNDTVITGIIFTTGHCRVIFWPDVGLFNVAPIIQASFYTNTPSPKRKCPNTVGIFKKWLSYSRGLLSQVATRPPLLPELHRLQTQSLSIAAAVFECCLNYFF